MGRAFSPKTRQMGAHTEAIYHSPGKRNLPASRHAPTPKHNPTAISCKRSGTWADARRGLLRLFRSGRTPNSMRNTPAILLELRLFMAAILPHGGCPAPGDPSSRLFHRAKVGIRAKARTVPAHFRRPPEPGSTITLRANGPTIYQPRPNRGPRRPFFARWGGEDLGKARVADATTLPQAGVQAKP